MIQPLFNSTLRFINLLSGKYGNNSLATLGTVNSLVTSINNSQGGSTGTLIYECTGTSLLPTLIPIHAFGDGGQLKTTSCVCATPGSGGGRGPYVYTNGSINPCAPCWWKKPAIVDPADFKVVLDPTILADPDLPIGDFNITIGNPNPLLYVGITETTNYTFRVVPVDLATGAPVLIWPVGTRLVITFWFGSFTEG